MSLSAQNQKSKISVNINNKTLAEALTILENKSGCLFFYYEGFVKSDRKIQLKAENQTLNQILDQLFANTDNTYTIDGRQVFIKKRATSTESQQKQKIQINGRIVDENGIALPGATIMLQGAAIIAVANDDGYFTINVPAGSEQFVVSSIGYTTQLINISQSRLIRMQISDHAINKVVVTGIFNRKTEGYTGSATTITGADLQRVGNQNVFQSLKNLDPALYIPSNWTMGSDPNTLPDMQLRGTSTFSTEETADLKGYYQKPNTPLFILDGFETTLEQVYYMDMNRIQSLTILKDAAAKAIYGSKAANGVVVIETKKMTAEEPRITYNGSVSFEMPDLTSYNLCNALEKLEAEQTYGYYTSRFMETQMQYDELYNERLKTALEGKSTYWLSKPLRVGIGTKHALSVELGEKDLKSIVNFSYNDVEGVMKGSEYTTLAGDVNLSYRRKNVLFKNIMSITSKKSNDSPYGSFSSYAKMNSYWDPYNADGSVKKTLGYTNSTDLVSNPLYDATLDVVLQNTSLNLNNNFYVEIDFLNDFKFKSSFGISSQRFDDEEFYPSDHSKFNTSEYTVDEDAALLKGSYALTTGKSSSLTGKFDLQYNKVLGKHQIFADLTYDLSQSNSSETSIEAVGFPSGKANNINFARQYAEGSTPSAYDYVKRDMGFLEYLSYNYDNRYITDLTFRTNGSSAFGNDNPWANFWSAGLAWNLNNESFLSSIKDLSKFRLKGSYGTSGNQNFSQNTSYAIYTYNTTGQYQGFYGANLYNMENPNLKWEFTKEADFSLDMEYRNLSLKAEYYHKNVSNMVIDFTLAPSVGFGSVRENLGETENKGWEFSLAYEILKSKKGFLNLYGSVTTNENKILKISDALETFNNAQLEVATRGDQSTPVLMYKDGMPVNAIWAVRSLGIDPVNGYEVFLNKDGEKTYTWSASDEVCCGTTDPKYNGIVGLNGEYRGFGINITATFLGGCKAYNQTLVDKVENIDIAYNVDRRALTDRWTSEGQEAKYTSLTATWTNPETNQTETMVTRATSRFVQNRDEFSLSSVSLYYDLQRKLVEKMHFKQLRCSFYMNDIYTWSTIDVERGTTYPFARTMSFAVTGTF